jgi:hypothetical protein
MLSGLVPLTESQQRLALYAISMYQRGECDDNKVTMRVQDIHHIVGGEKNRIYRTLRDNAKHLKNAQIIEGPIDPATGDTVISSYFSEIKLKPGEGEFIATLSNNLIDLISEIKTKYILVHLANIRKLRGSTVISLYMVFAQWDSMGILSLTSKELADRLQLSDSMAVVSRLAPKIIAPALAKIKKGIGVEIAIRTEGRGINATITFSWPPNALRSAAGDQPDLPGMRAVNINEGSLVMAGMEARLRQAGVLDKAVFAVWLHRLPIAETSAIVEGALRDGLKNSALRDRIVARVSDTLLVANRRQAEAARAEAVPVAPGPDKGEVESLEVLAKEGGPHRADFLAWIDGQGEFARDMAARDPDTWRRYWAEDALRSGRVGDVLDVPAEHVPPPPLPSLADVPDAKLERLAAMGSLLGLPVGAGAAQIRARVAELEAKGHQTGNALLMSLMIMGTPDDGPSEPMVKGEDFLEVDPRILEGAGPRRRGRPKKADR